MAEVRTALYCANFICLDPSTAEAKGISRSVKTTSLTMSNIALQPTLGSNFPGASEQYSQDAYNKAM